MLFIHNYPPLPVDRYSFIQLSELEQCRVKIRFHTAAEDSNVGSLSRESEVLPQRHCATL